MICRAGTRNLHRQPCQQKHNKDIREIHILDQVSMQVLKLQTHAKHTTSLKNIEQQ